MHLSIGHDIFKLVNVSLAKGNKCTMGNICKQNTIDDREVYLNGMKYAVSGFLSALDELVIENKRMLVRLDEDSRKQLLAELIAELYNPASANVLQDMGELLTVARNIHLRKYFQ